MKSREWGGTKLVFLEFLLKLLLSC